MNAEKLFAKLPEFFGLAIPIQSVKGFLNRKDRDKKAAGTDK